MQRLIKSSLPVLILGLLVGCFALGSTPVGADGETDVEARKAKILANLTLQFPQLKDMAPTMGELKATDFEGLYEGTFVVRGQPQKFLVSKDDTQLFLVQGQAIDVSRSAEEIQVEVAKREEEEMKEATERSTKLADAVKGEPTRGSADAAVTIIEFSDFQCPYCTRGAATVEELLAKYPNDIKFVFKHFPLDFHPWAKPASIAAICAGNQNHDAFWTLHDKYFEHQKELTLENVVAKSREYLAGSSVDMDAWATCAENKESAEYQSASQQVDADLALGKSLGVSGTPGFFVNGVFLNGAQPAAAFEPLIQQAKTNS